MRRISIILLIVLSITLVTPLSSFSLNGAGESCDMLSSLDVCNSAAPALSSNGKMPCLHMTAKGIIPVVFVTIHETAYPVFPELILATRNEQPPRS